jgi:hypothetical protein
VSETHQSMLVAALRFRDRKLTSTADLMCSRAGSLSFVFRRFEVPPFAFLLMDPTARQ